MATFLKWNDWWLSLHMMVQLPSRRKALVISLPSDSLTSQFHVRNAQGTNWKSKPESPLTNNIFILWSSSCDCMIKEKRIRLQVWTHRSFLSTENILGSPNMISFLLFSPFLLSLHLHCTKKRSFFCKAKLPGSQILPALYWVKKNKNSGDCL